ncbi:NAD-dependent epimerase/dehydratase family protein [Methylobacterium sp. P1-11]|uniref:NAD-dependent epimerase/dehydratase family protein n=1 Tax=Methylobacterium sp. P1-11 TaxID=2024616 RepID=UPI0011EC3870|nr:NAD-dependent epimerase/dehydratase family protein [Methylobacterium sp. P1-11]KAA0106037.1 NAD-dependent epimerase/dehydratase family protein [Methylobacterium sp. P1-11]
MRILVTGAGGVVGAALTSLLQSKGYNVKALGSRRDCNLENFEDTLREFIVYGPTHVFHLAGAVYGLGGNLKFPADIFRRNLLINTHVIEASRLLQVEKIVAMGTIAMYPAQVSMPFKEDDVLNGPVHESERFYAAAKRAMLEMLESYKAQYGTNYAFALSTNLYGPSDRFDEFYGHVVPSLIRKFHRAASNKGIVEVWGDGSAERDFLYSEDAAAALLILMEKGTGVFNLATGVSTKIKFLVETLHKLYPAAEYCWDTSKPLGQVERSYDVSRIRRLGFEPQFLLENGLRRTVDWYSDNLKHLRSY